MWDCLPCCLPATLQIVNMVPRSGDSECTPLRSALSILFTLNLASQFTVGQLGNLGDDFNGPGTIATTTTRVSYGLEIGDEVHIDPTGSPIHSAGCHDSPMDPIINDSAFDISTGSVFFDNTTTNRHFEVLLTMESNGITTNHPPYCPERLALRTPCPQRLQLQQQCRGESL